MNTPKATPGLRKYFWDRVGIPFDTTDEDCWLWVGHIGPDGYGVAAAERIHVRAHQLSFVLHRGPLVAGTHIAHTCDNRPCVNPNHLRQWLPSQNFADAAAKKRYAHGENHYKSKLSDCEVLGVIRLWAVGVKQKDIASWLGVSKGSINDIVKGKRRAMPQR
jgi:hypothetical protein